MLEVENINVSYGDLNCLYDVSVTVKEGEIVSIVGSNGAGKSTLLKAIAGLVRVRSGSIYFHGKEIANLPTHEIIQLGLTLIPEGRKLFPSLSVIDNLELGAFTPRARGKKDENLKLVFRLFPILEQRKHQLARTLSGGEQQMLAIGRALMSDASLILLDEPSLGLAPKIVSTVFATLEELNKFGIAILLVEQNAKKALEVSARAYVMEHGKIVMEGAGKQLLQDNRVKKAYLGM